MTFSAHAIAVDTDGVLLALKAQAYLKHLGAGAYQADVSDLLSDGFALVAALLKNGEGADSVQQNQRTLAHLVLERMHLLARESAANGTRRAYPCFSC